MLPWRATNSQLLPTLISCFSGQRLLRLSLRSCYPALWQANCSNIKIYLQFQFTEIQFQLNEIQFQLNDIQFQLNEIYYHIQ